VFGVAEGGVAGFDEHPTTDITALPIINAHNNFRIIVS
jgi:hypothetical protein